jgi:hypothetical protein
VDDNFIPYLHADGTLSLPNGKAKMKLRGNPARLGRQLVQSNIVRHKLAMRVLPSRSRETLERWYEEWTGITDSLLLFSVDLFNEENRPLIRFIFRKIFHIAMFNVDQVTSHWKEFTNCFWNNVSKSITLEDVILRADNPFRVLLANEHIHGLFTNGLQTKCDAQSVAHLVSTRQLVPGAAKVQVKALDKFYSTCSQEFLASEVNLARAELGGRLVARKVIDFGKTKDLSALCHISLSTAGDVDFSKANGGRGAAIQDAIIRILDDIPSASGNLLLPFGITVREEQGVPRYCTWGRPENLKLKKVLPSQDPRWKKRFVWSAAPVYGFGNPREDCSPDEPGGTALEGYDEYLGVQIFYCALYVAFNEGYMDYLGNFLKPVPAQTSVVPEPGGKARVITTTKWWVQILEQPFGHLTKALLSAHPSASAGLQRADQAWLYLDLLHKVQQVPDAYVLSSDLEEATDAISPVVAERMIVGFYRRIYGVIPKLIEIGISVGLRSTRVITISYPRSSGRLPVTFTKRRGILMGEPVTKSLLTLYSLICEELAMRDYLYQFSLMDAVDPRWELSMTYSEPVTNSKKKFHARTAEEWRIALSSITTLPRSRILRLRAREGNTGHWLVLEPKILDSVCLALSMDKPRNVPDHDNVMFSGVFNSVETYLGPVTAPWRAFAVGGDDHIAYGPWPYLKLITGNHHAFGSKISLPKHGYSKVAVKFCEKILLLSHRDLTIPPWKINSSTELYNNSVWVDSIKVRLLSPLTKSMDAEDDRNTAIGKSGSFSRSIAWLNSDFFPSDWCDMTLSRFMYRMYPYLPSPIGKDQALFWQLKLPSELGGLGLRFKGEKLSHILLRCPLPTRAFVKALVDSQWGSGEAPSREIVRAFRRLCTATSARGIAQDTITDEVQKILLAQNPRHY